MSTPPDWAPSAGEVYGDWQAKLISTGFVIWDYVEDTDSDADHLSTYYGAGDETLIDSDVDFISLRSDSDTDSVVLPKISEFGVGRTITAHVTGVKDVRIRARGDYDNSVVFINGSNCAATNEITIPEDTMITCTAIKDNEWRVVGWNSTGTNVAISPVARGA